MTKKIYSFEKLIARITAWAKKRDDIRAAIVLGSRARTDTPADEWSDLDVVLSVNNPSFYLDSTDWLKRIGEVKILFLEPNALAGGSERRVLFECGLDVDFIFISAARLKSFTNSPDPVSQSVLSRGYRILFDKDDKLPPAGQLPGVPVMLRILTPAEFDETVNDFWYHAVWTAKKLRRGELWVALRCCDYYMKNLLLKVVECHAQVTHGEKYDTWFGGRFLEQWADHRVVKDLENSFARYGRKDIRRALFATMDLFRWITRDIAEKGGYLYPATADEYATNLVSNLLPE